MNLEAAQPAGLSGRGAPSSASPQEPEGALNVRDAASQLSELLSDDGRSPGDDGSGKHARDQVDGDDLDNGDDDDGRNPPVEDDAELDDDSDTDDLDEGDDTSDDNDDPDESDDDDDDSGDEITTIEALSEALEMEQDDLKKLTLTFKAAGEDVTAPLSEIIAGYQKDSDYRKNTAALAEERKTFTNTVKTQQDTYTQQSTVLAQVIGSFENGIKKRLQSDEMAALRTSDPSEWNARMIEANNQLTGLQQMRTAASADFEKFKEGTKRAFLKTQGEILAKDVPDWGAEKLDIAQNVMKNYGFSDDEIPEIADARLIKAALAFDEMSKELAALKEQKAKGKRAATKVKEKVPKTLKPGSKGKAKSKRPNFDNAKRRLKANPTGKRNTAAAADAIEQLLVSVD